jgi:hypothetical protein
MADGGWRMADVPLQSIFAIPPSMFQSRDDNGTMQ